MRRIRRFIVKWITLIAEQIIHEADTISERKRLLQYMCLASSVRTIIKAVKLRRRKIQAYFAKTLNFVSFNNMNPWYHLKFHEPCCFCNSIHILIIWYFIDAKNWCICACMSYDTIITEETRLICNYKFDSLNVIMKSSFWS